MTQDDKRIKWQSHYEAWKESGLNVAAWCREHHLKEYQMYYWIRKIEDANEPTEHQDPTTSWLPIQLDDPVAHGLNEEPVFRFGCLSLPELCRNLPNVIGSYFPPDIT